MDRKIAMIVRCILLVITTYCLIYINGLVGVIDVLQLTEVFWTALVISIAVRRLKKRGILYFMEWTSIIAGIVWAIVNGFLMWSWYHKLEAVMISTSAISFWYGLLLSLFSSLLIMAHIKKRSC